MKIETECSSCRGTGIYHGFAEPEGVGVVCVYCNGTGCHEVEYKPFTGRKTRDDIKMVRLSSGTLIVTGVGPTGNAVTYNEFINGKMPR